MQMTNKNTPEALKYVITGDTPEEVNDQLNLLEVDLIKRFGRQPESANEIMAFVASLRVSVMKRFDSDLVNDVVEESSDQSEPN